MSANRRTFLQFAGLAPAAAVAGAAAASPAPAAKASVNSLTRSAFEGCLGDAFSFEKEVFGEVTARLARVDALDGCRTESERESRFSLRLDVQGEGVLEQASYRVHHPRLGDFVMFVVPRDGKGRVLEAVFNRL